MTSLVRKVWALCTWNGDPDALDLGRLIQTTYQTLLHGNNMSMCQDSAWCWTKKTTKFWSNTALLQDVSQGMPWIAGAGTALTYRVLLLFQKTWSWAEHKPPNKRSSLTLFHVVLWYVYGLLDKQQRTYFPLRYLDFLCISASFINQHPWPGKDKGHEQQMNALDCFN